jgi:hypothetical protein
MSTSDVRIPPDATQVGEWFDSGTVRRFTGTKRRGPLGVSVDIIGEQSGDGTVERFVCLDAPGDVLLAAEAQDTVRDLQAAIDEISTLAAALE